MGSATTGIISAVFMMLWMFFEDIDVPQFTAFLFFLLQAGYISLTKLVKIEKGESAYKEIAEGLALNL